MHVAVWAGFAPLAKSVEQISPGHNAISQSKKQGDSFSLLFSRFPNISLPFPTSSSHSRKRAKTMQTSPSSGFREEREARGADTGGRTCLSTGNLLHRDAGPGGGLMVVVTSDSTSPACSPGENWPSSHTGLTEGTLSQDWAPPGGALKEGMDGGVHTLCALSPAAFTSNTFLKGSKPSTRMETGSESAVSLAGGLQLTKGITPPPPGRME